jgi:hypothetical protein
MIDSPRARVVHSLPGRVRLRLERGEGTTVEPLLARLREQQGVRSARFNPVSGSIVVEYNPAAVTETALLSGLPVATPTVATSTVATSDVAPSASPIAHTLTTAWWNADTLLARATSGWIDLRTFIPLALALLALRQIARGGFEAASWHTLLWYSYNIMYHFNPELRQPPRPLSTVEDGVP